MKTVFDQHYKKDFVSEGLLKPCHGELTHFLSDVASMRIITLSDGGWGMCAHNYDGDLLTDEIAQVHRSPGFLTSVLNGVNDDGSLIKEFEASHGTVTDMWHAHLRGEETSLNPLSMMEALIGAMKHSAALMRDSAGGDAQVEKEADKLTDFCGKLQGSIHVQMTSANGGTRDLCGASGLTTKQFVAAVKARLDAQLAAQEDGTKTPMDSLEIDIAKVRQMLDAVDTDKSGRINFDGFVAGLQRLAAAPRKNMA